MRNWLKPIADALHERATSLQIFVRDDDAGWDDARLMRLVDSAIVMKPHSTWP